jgi:hypothetical protein
VYNNGPTEPREPLYHTDPFFIEFNGISDATYVNKYSPLSNKADHNEFNNLLGIYVDNPSQICIDILGVLLRGEEVRKKRRGGDETHVSKHSLPTNRQLARNLHRQRFARSFFERKEE